MPKSTATTRARLVDEQIALVHVGVEEAVAHGVAQEGLQDGEAERLQVEAGGTQGGVVRDGDAVDPFERQHAPRGAPPVDAGHAEAAGSRRGVAGDVVGHLGDGGGLEPHVHLDLDGARQRVDHGDGSQPPRGRMEALDLAGGEEVAVEIAAEAPLDAGAQDLHRHVAAHAIVDDDGLVHLGDGGRRHRRPELGEVVLQPAAQRLLDGLARLPHREGRQLVLQVAQIAGELRPDQVGAGGEELPELDVAGAEAGERAGDAPLLRLDASATARSARGSAGSRRARDAAPTAPWSPPARSARRAAPARCRRAPGGRCCRGSMPWCRHMTARRLRHHHIRRAVNGWSTASLLHSGIHA